MKETKFIEQNKQKWTSFEKLLSTGSNDPDKLSAFFIQITDDLSYARTFYNNRSIRVYLNNICQQLFYKIYKSPKKRNAAGFMKFWREGLPLIAYQSRKELLASLVIFLIAIAIGAVSAEHDSEFIRIILGDQYVEMTMENIQSGDPMAVYKKSNEFDMFLGITFNNLLVAVRTFLTGIIFALGSVIVLLFNGIMVGAFQYFFVEQGLFRESFLTIWLHGTLEISSIVIAGASGIVLGKGIIAPGAYSRLQAFQIAAKRGARLFLGIVPILIFAALIESFLTRYTEAPDALRLTLIVISLAFMIFYFIWYPRRVALSMPKEARAHHDLQVSPNFNIQYRGIIKTAGDILRDVFLFYRKYSRQLINLSLITSVLYVPIAIVLIYPTLYFGTYYTGWFSTMLGEFTNYEASPILLGVNALFLSVNFLAVFRLLRKDIEGPSWKPNRNRGGIFLIYALIMNLALNGILAFNVGLALIGGFFVTPILVLMLFVVLQEGKDLNNTVQRTFELLKGNYGFLYGLTILITLIVVLVYLLLNTPFTLLYLEFIKWNIPLDEEVKNVAMVVVNSFVSAFSILVIIPLLLSSIGMSYFTLEEINEAKGLKEKLLKFGRS